MEHKKLDLLHVVHRYGPVGGMERYVWELTHELHRLGHRVTVVCEQCCADLPDGIEVIELGKMMSRPRWIAQMRFSSRVARWLKAHPLPGRLVHSHERIKSHHITTFHGHPFATIYEKPFWKRLSLRVWMRLFMEWRELSVAKIIVPNSGLMRHQLEHYYPKQKQKLAEPIAPGVSPVPLRDFRRVSMQGGVIGFVGSEWKRKGLTFAAQIVKKLRTKRPELELWVVGPSPNSVQHVFDGWEGGYRLMGWRRDEGYLKDIDVLLHPAIAEPYGMVISEAMAARVPVVVSNVCGAADHVKVGAGQTLELSDSEDDWVAAIEIELTRQFQPPGFERSWHQVALEYEALYRTLN